MRCFDRLHSRFPMLVAQSVPYRVDFSASAQQTSVIGLGLEIFEGQEHEHTKEGHELPGVLIGHSPP